MIKERKRPRISQDEKGKRNENKYNHPHYYFRIR